MGRYVRIRDRSFDSDDVINGARSAGILLYDGDLITDATDWLTRRNPVEALHWLEEALPQLRGLGEALARHYRSPPPTKD